MKSLRGVWFWSTSLGTSRATSVSHLGNNMLYAILTDYFQNGGSANLLNVFVNKQRRAPCVKVKIICIFPKAYDKQCSKSAMFIFYLKLKMLSQDELPIGVFIHLHKRSLLRSFRRKPSSYYWAYINSSD